MPLVIGVPNSVPFGSTKWAWNAASLHLVHDLLGPGAGPCQLTRKQRLTGEQSIEVPVDWAMKIALIAMLSKINITARTANTAAVTCNLSETVFSRSTSPRPADSPESRCHSEPVAATPNGMDQTRAPTSPSLRRRGDVHLDHILVKAVVAPYGGQDLGLAYHFVTMRGEVAQQSPLGIGQVE